MHTNKMGNLCGSPNKPQVPESKNGNNDSSIAPTLSSARLSMRDLESAEPALIKRQSSDSSVDTDVYNSVKGPKGMKLSMLQKQNSITESVKGASNATRKLVHDSDANATMKLWDVYEVTGNGKGKFLGKGATATVRLIQHKKTKKKYALKTVQLSKVLSASKRRSFRREVDMIRSLDHPNIIKITETFTDDKGDFHLVMPFCDGGELFDHLVNQNPARLSESEVWGFAKDMFGALNYLRKCHIVHRDIKLENYLFSGKSEHSNLLLVDFGFSQATPKGQKLKKSVGTLYTMAPEVISHNASYPADVWAVGVVLYTLVYGQYPFGPGNSTRQQMVYDIKHAQPRYPSAIAIISDELRDFFEKIFEKDHTIRMTAAEALNHKWLQTIPKGIVATSERSMSRHTSSLRDGRRRASTNPIELEKEKRESTQQIIDHMSTFRRMSTLKRMALLAIAQSMDHEKIHKLTDIFADFDTKKDGTIQWSELKNVLEKQHFIHNEEDKKEFKDLFRTVDQGKLVLLSL